MKMVTNDRGSDAFLVEVNIQDIIKERKAERKLKAEQKRQADLQRIKDMRSITGVDPLKLFPKLVWERIFEELDPEDLGNMWQLHPFFRGFLERYRVRDILFPQVLKVDKFQQTMGGGQLLSLRCICKSTRKAIDGWIDDGVSKRIEVLHDPCDMDFEDICLRFGEMDEHQLLNRLLSRLAEDDGLMSAKRFFPRTLTVSIGAAEHDEDDGVDLGMGWELQNQFNKDILTLLEAVGDRIWHFNLGIRNIMFESTKYTLCEVYLKLQQCLLHTPNLKWLVLVVDPLLPDEKVVPVSDVNLVAEKYPLPCLTHLKRLTLQNGMPFLHETEGKRTLSQIYTLLLRSNRHIKMLDFADNSALRFLKADDIQCPSLNFFASLGSNFKSFHLIQSIIDCNWPLQTIALCLNADENTNKSVVSIFRFLEQFPTLEEVDLDLNRFRVKDTHYIGYLKLPNIWDFRLYLSDPEVDYESSTHFFSLQFLLHCERLKNLSWKFKLVHFFDSSKFRNSLRKYENENYGKVIDFRAGMRNLRDSNIWQVFPYLDTIYVKNFNSVRLRFECEHEYRRADLGSLSDGLLENCDCIFESASNSRTVLVSPYAVIKWSILICVLCLIPCGFYFPFSTYKE